MHRCVELRSGSCDVFLDVVLGERGKGKLGTLFVLQ